MKWKHASSLFCCFSMPIGRVVNFIRIHKKIRLLWFIWRFSFNCQRDSCFRRSFPSGFIQAERMERRTRESKIPTFLNLFIFNCVFDPHSTTARSGLVPPTPLRRLRWSTFLFILRGSRMVDTKKKTWKSLFSIPKGIMQECWLLTFSSTLHHPTPWAMLWWN